LSGPVGVLHDDDALDAQRNFDLENCPTAGGESGVLGIEVLVPCDAGSDVTSDSESAGAGFIRVSFRGSILVQAGRAIERIGNPDLYWRKYDALLDARASRRGLPPGMVVGARALEVERGIDVYAYLLHVAQCGRVGAMPRTDLSEPERVFQSVWTLIGGLRAGTFRDWICGAAWSAALDVESDLLGVGAVEAQSALGHVLSLLPPDWHEMDEDGRRRALDSLGERKSKSLDRAIDRLEDAVRDATRSLYFYVLLRWRSFPGFVSDFRGDLK